MKKLFALAAAALAALALSASPASAGPAFGPCTIDYPSMPAFQYFTVTSPSGPTRYANVSSYSTTRCSPTTGTHNLRINVSLNASSGGSFKLSAVTVNQDNSYPFIVSATVRDVVYCPTSGNIWLWRAQAYGTQTTNNGTFFSPVIYSTTSVSNRCIPGT